MEHIMLLVYACVGGLRPTTQSFSVPDCVRIMNVLMIRYQLDCTLNYDRGLPVIYIRAASMPLLRSIVAEHMDPSMLYKIGL
jgi:hypothetical protein